MSRRGSKCSLPTDLSLRPRFMRCLREGRWLPLPFNGLAAYKRTVRVGGADSTSGRSWLKLAGVRWCLHDSLRNGDRDVCSWPPSAHLGATRTSLGDGCLPERVPAQGVCPRVESAHLGGPAICCHAHVLGQVYCGRYESCRRRYGYESGHRDRYHGRRGH